MAEAGAEQETGGTRVPAMQPLLLTLGLGLLSAVRAQKDDWLIPATTETLLGKWYINRWIGTIPFPKEKKQEPLPPFSFVINYNRKLELRMYLRKPSGCQLLKLPFTKLPPPNDGAFITWWKHIIFIWMIRPKDSGIAYFEDKLNNQEVKMMMLFGRTLADRPEALGVFERMVKSKGLNGTDIITPPHVESCKLANEPS